MRWTRCWNNLSLPHNHGQFQRVIDQRLSNTKWTCLATSGSYSTRKCSVQTKKVKTKAASCVVCQRFRVITLTWSTRTEHSFSIWNCRANMKISETSHSTGLSLIIHRTILTLNSTLEALPLYPLSKHQTSWVSNSNSLSFSWIKSVRYPSKTTFSLPSHYLSSLEVKNLLAKQLRR